MSKSITFNDVIGFLAAADIDREQHRVIVDTINARLKRARKTVMNTLCVGDRVRWTGKYGVPMSGVVTGMGRSRVYVDASGGGRWSVSATLLTKI